MDRDDYTKILTAEECARIGTREGMKAAGVATVLTAIPTVLAARKIPWFKANLNHTGQALVVSGAALAAYFVTSEHAVRGIRKKNNDALYRIKSP